MDVIAQPADERATDPAGVVPRVEISLLGGFRITVDGQEIPHTAWKRRKARSVVKLLALAPRQMLHREAVLEHLWPDLDVDAATSNLRLLLHYARSAFRSFGDGSLDLIHLRDEQLRLQAPALGTIEIDVDRFTSAASLALRTGDPTALQAAIDHYTGDLLPEDRYDDWAAAPREMLRETYISLLLALADRHESDGTYEAARIALEHVLRVDELHEDAHAGLMRVYARTGRTGQALRQYARFRDVLRRELDMEPSGATQRLHADVAAGRVPAETASSEPNRERQPTTSTSISRRRHNLPEALTSLVGRQHELDEIRRMFQTTRLLSLVGTGGAGKSRLALELARELVDTGDDDVWLVELASRADPTVVPDAVAAVVGIRQQQGQSVTETLVDELRSRAMVLVIDNCEHLIDACASLIETLLAACPHLRVIITSREALRVAGEVVGQVPSLAVPPVEWSQLPLDSLSQIAAVALFVSRIRWVRPDFVLTREDAAALVQICRRLDGLPLALELAAARASVLSLGQLADRLDNALGVLTSGSRTAPARQKTLQATLDWSYALLDAQKRTLLRRLSVFAGGWTLDAAEAVCAGPSAKVTDDCASIERGDVLSLMAQLIDKSLVQVDDRLGSTETRYRLLQTVRQYAAERLESGDEAERIGDQHAAYFLALAQAAQPMFTGSEQAIWLNRLDRDNDNLRAVFRWFNSHGEIASEARLCFALLRFWYYYGHLAEGNRLLDSLIPRIDDPAVPPLVRARILQGAGVLAWNQGDLQGSTSLSRRALAIFEQLGDRRGISDATQTLGVVAEIQGEYAEATALYQVALTMRESLDDTVGIAVILHNLGNIAREQREPHRAAEYYGRCLAIQRSLGNTRGIALALASLALVALDQGDYAASADYSLQSLELYEQVSAKSLRVTALNNLGYALQFLGDPQRAIAVQADCLRLAVEIGDQRGIAYGLEGSGSAFAMAGAGQDGAEQAARAFGAADALRGVLRVPLPPADLAVNAPAVEAARASLGQDRYQTAWLAGRTRALEDSIDKTLAMAEMLVTRSPSLADDAPARRLSPREHEVAMLIANGKTNREIASELGMANRTVDTHVRNLLRKLKFSSRTDVAAWASANGLLADDTTSG